MAREFYDNYVTNHLGHYHRDDYEMMSRYYKKNYLRYISGKKDKILDVACGMGHFLYFLKENGFENYVGVDLSSECISACKEKQLGDDSNLLQVDALDFFQKSEERFDLIVMNDIIEHIDKELIPDFLRAAKNMLKEGGRLVIKVVNSANPITGSSSRYYDFTHVVGFTQESMAQVLRVSGFDRIAINPQDIWVFNPIVNVVGTVLQGLFSWSIRFLFLLYGRKSTTIFTKDIIAVAYR